MSIWSSVPGNDPVIYEGDEGAFVELDGWFDVATTWGGKVRIIIKDSEGSSRIALDAAGLAELHRRITIVRLYMEQDKLA